MDDPIQARLIQEALHRMAEDAQAGHLADVDRYVELFPAVAERVREEYAALIAPGSESAGEAGAGDGEPIDGARVGPYRIQREIGRGGQGVVYLAEDTRHGRRVALKVLPASLGLQSARVRREIDAIARLDHPGLCVVYDAGEAEGRAYVAMRHVQGQALDARVREWSAARPSGIASGSRGRSEVVERVELIEKVARALHAAHEVGVTHRDVKPANILVRDDGDPVLLDFGLARLDDSEPNLTRTGELVGTLPYMAPERLAGGKGDTPVADVWSLGVTLYEVLAGRRPFEGATLDVVARHIERDEPTDVRRLSPAVSRDLAVIASTALSKDPFKRYPTAEAFADDLARWRDGRPIAARPVGLLGRMTRWTKRNPVVALLVAVLLAALVGALLAADRLADLADREREATELAHERLEGEEYARRTAQALLARASFDQAQVEQDAGHGVRGRELAERATESWLALGESRDANGDELAAALDDLPSIEDLRALHASLDGVAVVASETVVQRSTFGDGGLSADGAMLAQVWINAEMTSYGARVVDVVTGDEVGRMTDYDLVSRRSAHAVSRDGGWCVAPSREANAIGLWSTRTQRCELWLALPPEWSASQGSGDWSLAFLDAERAVLGVFTEDDGRGAVIVWRHGVDRDTWHDESRVVLPYATAASLDLPSVEPHIVAPEPMDAGAWHAITPDRRTVFVPSRRGEVRQLHVTDGVVATWSVPDDAVVAAFAPACDALVAASQAGRLSVIVDGVLVRTVDIGTPIHPSLEVHPTAPVIACLGTDRALRLTDLRTGEQLARVADVLEASASLDEIRFTADGRGLVVHPKRGATKRWTVTLPDGWRAGDTANLGAGATSWAWSAAGDAVAEVREGALAVRDSAAVAATVDAGVWARVHAVRDGWVVVDEGKRHVARFAWPRDQEGDLAVDVGSAREVVAVCGTDQVLRVFTQLADGAFEFGDAVDDDVEWRTLAPAGEQWLVASPSGRSAAVLPLTGARSPMTLSTGAVLVHDLDAGTSTSIEGLDVGFRDVFGAAISADERWFAAHVYRPANDAEDASNVDRFVALWSLADGGSLVARWPSAHASRAASPVFVDTRWLAVPRVGGRVSVVDLSAPQEPWLTFHAFDGDAVPRVEATDGGLVAWREGGGERARHFNLERLAADLAARDL